MGTEFIVFWCLVVWRITTLLTTDTITGPMRDKIGVYYGEYSECIGRNFIARALCCHRCTSIWVALAVTLIFIQPALADFLPVVLMLSAGSIVINRITDGK
jgi:hypothetical protein